VAKKAAGGALGNSVNLAEAGPLGRVTLIERADDFARRTRSYNSLIKLLRRLIGGASIANVFIAL